MQEEFKEGMRDFSSGNMNQDAMKEHALGFSWANAAKQYWDIYEQLLS